MFAHAIKVVCLTGALVALGAGAQARSPYARMTAACGPGYASDGAGHCIDTMDRNRTCPPGLFAIPFPNGNAFRCVPVAWQDSGRWLQDYFH